MSTEDAIAIATICKAINPTRPENDDGLPSMEQGLSAMYLRSYMEPFWVPMVGPVSKTAIDYDGSEEFHHALAHILRRVREEAQR